MSDTPNSAETLSGTPSAVAVKIDTGFRGTLQKISTRLPSPVIDPFYTYFGVFMWPPKSCKLLQVLLIKALKRPASAVQSRLWPPHSKVVSCKFERCTEPQFTRDCRCQLNLPKLPHALLRRMPFSWCQSKLLSYPFLSHELVQKAPGTLTGCH